MTDTRAPAEPYTTEFEATVERRDDREVVLDDTYFYAESGGQPADRGTIGGIPVVDVQERDGGVIHTIAEDAELAGGEPIVCAVDETFRTYCMRAHTASHVLYGAGRCLLSDLGYGGFDIGEEKVRIDFETTTDIDDETLVELERLANRTVWESRPVMWETVPVTEARDRETVAFNTKTEEGVFGESEGVRIVTIGGDDENWDSAACGGTHVSNTHEIGPITVLDRSNPGEGLTRVELAVGPTAIEQRTETRQATLDAARELGVPVAELPEAIERQRREIGELADDRDELLERIATAQLNALSPIDRGDERWLVGSVGGVDGDTLADQARTATDGTADVVALVSDSNPVTIAAASASETDASTIVADVTAEFGGGGGGGSEFAQGGGIAEDPETVVDYLRGR